MAFEGSSMRTVLRLLFGLAALGGVAFSAGARQFDPSLFSDLRWRLIGPFRGGRVLAVTGVPGEPSHFYFGSVGGGVWETTNTGRTWTPILDDQPVASIGAIAAAPSDPRVLYVGSGEADMRSDISVGNGVYVSADGGRSWKHAGLEDSHQIGRIVVDPRDAKVALVAALGHAYAGNPTRGLYRTEDGGASWARVLSGGDDTGAIDVAIAPGHPDTVFAALWQTRRPPWNSYPPSNGAGSGLFRSDDGGRRWAPVAGGGFPAQDVGRIGVAFAPSRADRVFALVDSRDGGLYRSDDGGRRWTRVSADMRIWQRGWYFGGVTVDPKDPDVVYVCNTAIYRSTDAGATFRPFKGSPGGDDYHQLWIDPAEPRRMITGVDQGATITTDGGATWSSWYNQPTAQLYHVATDTRFPYRVYGAQQDSGAAMVASRSDWQSILPWDWRPIAAGYENGYIAPDPLDPRIVYGAEATRFDQETLQNRDVDPTRALPASYRHAWTLPLVFSRRNPKVLYFANQRLFRTEDGGARWEPISPDLSRENPGAPPNLDAVTARHSPVDGPRRGVIYTIAPSFLRDGEIWCGTDDGSIWRTGDEGKHWTNVTPANLSSWSKVTMLEASRFDADTVYAAVDRHRLDDFRPHVYRTRDGGKTWAETSAGIPDGSFLHVVREDPARRGLLYAGTERGVFVSFDGGDAWQPLRLNLPVCSVRDIDVHGSDVVIATHGRSFWILDDVSPLRQIGDGVERSVAFIFVPDPAWRIHPAIFQGTPVPKDEPAGENPPPGATIDYWIGSSSTGPVTLEIRDATGAILRRLSSTDPSAGPDLAKIVVTPDWEKPQPRVSSAPGMHRIHWDLHTLPPTAFALADKNSEDSNEAGLWVPPGRYTVRLTAGGRAWDRVLEVRRDPRIAPSDSDLVAQYELSRTLERTRIALADASVRLRDLRRRVESLGAGGSGELGRAAAAFGSRAASLAGTSDRLKLFGGGGDLARFSGITFALANLAGVLESADGAPSADDRRAVEAHSALADRVFASWKDLVARDLGRVNEALRAAGREPLAVP